MGGIDLSASEAAVIGTAALVSGILVRAFCRSEPARDGRLARELLLALDRALRIGPPPTPAELGATTTVRSTPRVRRAVALLEASGLLARADARIVSTEEQLWVERRLHLTPAGAAAVRAMHPPQGAENDLNPRRDRAAPRD